MSEGFTASYISKCSSITEVRQGRHSRQAPESGTELERLAPRLKISQLSFLLSPGPPDKEEFHPHWAGFLHQLAARQCPTDMPTGQSDRSNSSMEVPFSQVCQTDSQDLLSQCGKYTSGIYSKPVKFYTWMFLQHHTLRLRLEAKDITKSKAKVMWILLNWESR